MIVTETRLVKQEWYETELTKTGWDSHGWVFQDDGQLMPDEWTVVNHLQSDKFYNPILGIAEKEIDVKIPKIIMKWISVDDKMPEENQWAFFYFGLQKPMVGIYKTKSFLCIEDGEFWSVKNDEITHWMPLPEPPQVAA